MDQERIFGSVKFTLPADYSSLRPGSDSPVCAANQKNHEFRIAKFELNRQQNYII